MQEPVQWCSHWPSVRPLGRQGCPSIIWIAAQTSQYSLQYNSAQEYTYMLQCINLITFLIVQFHRNNIDIRSPLQPIKIIQEGLVLFAWGNGDAVWQIRRRFQQVRSLHQALSVLVCHAPAVACCGMVADIVLPGMGLFGFMNYCWYHDIVEFCTPKDQKHQPLEKDENGLWDFTLRSYDDLWWLVNPLVVKLVCGHSHGHILTLVW